MSDLVGKTGTVTVEIKGTNSPGCIQLPTSSGTLNLIAYADQRVARHTSVVVYADRGAMCVDVEALNNSEED